MSRIEYNVMLGMLEHNGFKLDTVQVNATVSGQLVTISLPADTPTGYTVTVGPPQSGRPDQESHIRALVFRAVQLGLPDPSKPKT